MTVAGSEAPPFWYAPDGWHARLLAPVSWIYGAAARWRLKNANPTKVDAPVLCVGNLTVGGTGKTPTAIALAKTAMEMGLKPGFLTRGYGGTHVRPRKVDADSDTARAVGDEPILLARVAPTMVSRQRAAGARRLVDEGCDFLIMDDGFQSRVVHYDYALITLDARRGIGNRRVIPAGPMRAPLVDQMRLCDGVLRIGDGDQGEAVVRAAARAAKPVMHARLKPTNLRAISRKQVLAYTGIGDPQKFFDTLSTFGCWLTAQQVFGDHHMFTTKDAEHLLMLADSEGLELVTTEKDYARLGNVDGPLGELRTRSHVLPIQLAFEVRSDGNAIITNTLKAYDRRRLANA